jgi:hypothetical protein
VGQVRILLATPTRGRPASFKEMVRSARKTATHPEHLYIIARIDHDDPMRGGYLTERGYTLLQGQRVLLPVAWNEIASTAKYDILMMCADDLRFRTTGWDDDVVRAFEQWPDRIGLVYADDGIHGEKASTHAFVSKEWVQTVGYYLPPTLTGDFVDNWLMSLALNIDRKTYLDRVYIEHRHPMANKAAMDDTYSYRWNTAARGKASDLWDHVVSSGELEQAVGKLKEATSES